MLEGAGVVVDGLGPGVLGLGSPLGLGLLLGLLLVLGLGSPLGLGLLLGLLLVLGLGVADAELCVGDVLIIGVLTGLGLRLGVGLNWTRGMAVLAAEAEPASMISPPLGGWLTGSLLAAAAVGWIAHGLTGGGGVEVVPAAMPTLPARNMLAIPDETRENPAKKPNAG
jgi:hypothetical protein